MSLIGDIAQAVTDELNAAEAPFEPKLEAMRHYRPVYDAQQLKQLRVTVVPRGIAIESASRNCNQQDVSVDIAVQKKLLSADLAEIDPLMSLVEQIGGYFRGRRLKLFPAAMLIRTENLPVYSLEHLEQMRVFTSVLTLTFRVIR